MSVCPVFPFPRDDTRPLDPAPELAEMRQRCPIAKVPLWEGREAWLVTRHDDVRDLLVDPRISVVTQENTPVTSAASASTRRTEASFLRMDPPEHTQQRLMWQAFFAQKNMTRMRPSIQCYIDAAIDDMLASGPPVDLVEKLGLVVPTRVIAELLALPETDHKFLQEANAIRLDLMQTADNVSSSKAELYEYIEAMVDERSVRPGDDLVSQMIVNEYLPGHIGRPDLVAAINLIIVAGHDTTANMISLGVRTLLQAPHLIDAIRADPSKTPDLVEELLRYLTIAQTGVPRVAMVDFELRGMAIKAGDGMILHLPSANRDENSFKDPDALVLGRPPRRHVAFGGGIHLCIGAPLARTELQMVFDTLFARIPTLRLAADDADLDYKFQSLFYGMKTLPVAW